MTTDNKRLLLAVAIIPVFGWGLSKLLQVADRITSYPFRVAVVSGILILVFGAFRVIRSGAAGSQPPLAFSIVAGVTWVAIGEATPDAYLKWFFFATVVAAALWFLLYKRSAKLSRVYALSWSAILIAGLLVPRFPVGASIGLAIVLVLTVLYLYNRNSHNANSV